MRVASQWFDMVIFKFHNFDSHCINILLQNLTCEWLGSTLFVMSTSSRASTFNFAYLSYDYFLYIINKYNYRLIYNILILCLLIVSYIYLLLLTSWLKSFLASFVLGLAFVYSFIYLTYVLFPYRLLFSFGSVLICYSNNLIHFLFVFFYYSNCLMSFYIVSWLSLFLCYNSTTWSLNYANFISFS